MRAIWITAAVLVLACTGRGKEKPTEQANQQPAAATDAGAAAVAAALLDGGLLPALPQKLEGGALADVEAFLARWLASQNDGDFPAYQAFYGDRFHGVRRSGRKVKRFDRAGWMRDRGAMFKRPMQVQSADLVAYAKDDRRQVFFTQTWAQGSYKDVGTKTIVLTGQGDDLRIVYEELLESKVQAPAAAGAGAARITDTVFGYDRAASLDTMRLARVAGGEVWLAITPREIAWEAPAIEALFNDPASGLPEAAIVRGKLPAGDALAKLAGVAVTVLGDDLAPACTGTLGEPYLRSAGAVSQADDPDAIIDELAKGERYVIAPLTAPCTGAFVRGAKAAALTAPATAAIPDRALRSLKTWDDATQEGTWEALAAGKHGFVLVAVHTENTCETKEAHTWALHRAELVGRTWMLTSAEDGDGEDSGLRVLDVDGDGELDAITRRGAYVGGTWQDWEPDLRVYWPAGLGCDGYDGDEETVGD